MFVCLQALAALHVVDLQTNNTVYGLKSDFNLVFPFIDHLPTSCKMRKGGARKPSPAFLRSAARTDTTKSVSEALLRQARKSGQLNLSNRSLEVASSKLAS